MEDMSEPYSDLHCRECGEDLFQLDGEYHCPECDGIDSFQLVNGSDSFKL